MSMHLNVSGLTRSLMHSLNLETLLHPLDADQQRLLDNYLSGHVPDSAWRDYVFENPALERHVRTRRRDSQTSV